MNLGLVIVNSTYYHCNWDFGMKGDSSVEIIFIAMDMAEGWLLN